MHSFIKNVLQTHLDKASYRCLPLNVLLRDPETSADTCMYATTLTMTACDFILKVTTLLLESPNYFD